MSTPAAGVAEPTERGDPHASVDAALFAGAMVLALAAMFALAGQGLQRWWVLLVVAPLVEEVIFRSGVQESLIRMPVRPVVANVLTALVFGLAHGWLRGDMAALGVAAPALVIGAVYSHTRRLLLCVLLHAVMNAAWVVWRMAFAGTLQPMT